MDACEIGNTIEGPFEELCAEMEGDMYWYRFFARPCCPAPDAEGAARMLDRLAADVDASGYDDGQKAELKQLIERRKEWYPTSGLCRAAG